MAFLLLFLGFIGMLGLVNGTGVAMFWIDSGGFRFVVLAAGKAAGVLKSSLLGFEERSAGTMPLDMDPIWKVRNKSECTWFTRLEFISKSVESNFALTRVVVAGGSPPAGLHSVNPGESQAPSSGE